MLQYSQKQYITLRYTYIVGISVLAVICKIKLYEDGETIIGTELK